MPPKPKTTPRVTLRKIESSDSDSDSDVSSLSESNSSDSETGLVVSAKHLEFSLELAKLMKKYDMNVYGEPLTNEDKIELTRAISAVEKK